MRTSHLRAKSWRTKKDLTLHQSHDPPWAPGWDRTWKTRGDILGGRKSILLSNWICQQEKKKKTGHGLGCLNCPWDRREIWTLHSASSFGEKMALEVGVNLDMNHFLSYLIIHLKKGKVQFPYCIRSVISLRFLRSLTRGSRLFLIFLLHRSHSKLPSIIPLATMRVLK